jgi:hypothetical protein
MHPFDVDALHGRHLISRDFATVDLAPVMHEVRALLRPIGRGRLGLDTGGFQRLNEFACFCFERRRQIINACTTWELLLPRCAAQLFPVGGGGSTTATGLPLAPRNELGLGSLFCAVAVPELARPAR